MNIPRPSPCCLGMKARLDSTVNINTSELSALGVLQIVLEPISEQANPQRVPRAKPAYCRTGFIFQSLIEVFLDKYMCEWSKTSRKVIICSQKRLKRQDE